MRLIVTSQKDIAGSNIFNVIKEIPGFTKQGMFENRPIYKRGEVMLVSTKKGQVEAEHLDDFFSPDYYVFASRHRSISGERTLTVHVPGNLTGEAKVGGRPKELALAEPDAMKTALQSLENWRNKLNLDYKVSMEVTHHGPTTLKKPVLFVEVGSTEREWRDPSALEAVANAALAAAENKNKFEKGIGVGGNHYAPRHTQFILRSSASLGHLIPSYTLDRIGIEAYEEAVKKSSATFFFLDWKGMKKEQRDAVLRMASELGFEVRRSTTKVEIKKDSAKLKRFKVSSELFELARKSDENRLRKCIVKNKGTPIEREGHLTAVLLAPSDIRNKVLKECIEVLKNKKPTLQNDYLLIEEKRFDPERAKELGLKPGPHFSTLKKGGEVVVGGRVIKPEEVVVLEKIKIHLDKDSFEFLKDCL